MDSDTRAFQRERPSLYTCAEGERKRVYSSSGEMRVRGAKAVPALSYLESFFFVFSIACILEKYVYGSKCTV